MNHYYIAEGKLRNNIGDILQGMSASQYLPEDANPVDRESLSDLNPDQPAFMIANGWYMHDFSKFPPPPKVYPLYISVHISNSDLLKSEKIRDHFRKYAPIGCRDDKTLRLFLGWGIPAYYSGCLTTTIKKPLFKVTPHSESILLVDNIDHPVPENIIHKLEDLFQQKIDRLNHNPKIVERDFLSYVNAGRKQIDDLLYQYCSAKLIITTKIHCALPCIGMGLPVILIHPNPADPRLYTVKQFIPVISYESLMKMEEAPISIVNHHRLKNQKRLLSTIVNHSVKNKSNVIKHPTSPTFLFIKIRSVIAAWYYRFIIILLLRLKISSQINRVFSS
ncbi:MAG: polysaccharide pyruvyl transferase family protein [Bacteroidota bacterium]